MLLLLLKLTGLLFYGIHNVLTKGQKVIGGHFRALLVHDFEAKCLHGLLEAVKGLSVHFS